MNKKEITLKKKKKEKKIHSNHETRQMTPITCFSLEFSYSLEGLTDDVCLAALIICVYRVFASNHINQLRNGQIILH